MRRDYDPEPIPANGRAVAKRQLFDPADGRIWNGNVCGEALETNVTILAYGNEAVGDGPGLHVHPYDELFIIVEGNARFFVGDVVIDATAGEVVHGPAGVPHRFENLGPGRLQTIDVHSSPQWIQADVGLPGQQP